MRTLWIGLAGAAGAVTRYHVDGFVSRRVRGVFPWGTLAVNLTGCFLLGLLVALLAERVKVPATTRAALTVGFLGAYTTFSTFALDSVRLGEDGAGGLALANVAASVVLGLLAAWAGLTLGRSL